MFKHSLVLIYRNILRFKSSFFINLTGLATGLSCVILIFLWVNDELSFDTFHEKDHRLYRVMEHFMLTEGIYHEEGTSGLLAETLAAEMPEVEYAATVVPTDWNPSLVLSVGDKDIRAGGQYVGKDYFNIFSFDFIAGNKHTVLSDKHNMVLSEGLAQQLFGTTKDLIGREVKLAHKKVFVISGVVRNPPYHSSQKFDFALSYEYFKDSDPWVLDWANSGPNTYLVLQEGTDPVQFEQKISRFLSTKGKNDHRVLFLQLFSDQYLFGRYENGQVAGGRIEYVRMFSVVAIFILLIACINFMNLSTAKASRRLKEVGVKKTLGASRRSLILQYLGESMLMAFLSLVLALLLVALFLPKFNEITGKQLFLGFDPPLLLSLLVVTLLTGLLSGSYPALYLSGFHPLNILKGGATNLKSSLSETWARKGLVVFQFSLSVMLIVAVFVVYKQIDYVQNKNLGYSKDNILYFKREGALWKNLDTFLAEARKLPGISAASSTTHTLLGNQHGTDLEWWEGKDPELILEFEAMEVNYDMLEMLDIQIASGRSFSRNFGADTSKIIFNETAIQVMGLSDPLGKTVKLWGEDYEIVGVASDFHYQSFHQKVKPLFIKLSPKDTWIVMLKIDAGREKESIAGLQQLYQQMNPGFPLNFKFLDEGYQAQYVAEQRVSVLSRYFAGFAILISCLGLYGLTAFAAEQRRKEIGIRKVLGASVSTIMALLSIDFIKLVSIAIVLGSLLSWIAMSQWLEGFAYRIEMGWWIFVVAGVAALLIALGTVCYQALKAAKANPVHNLRAD